MPNFMHELGRKRESLRTRLLGYLEQHEAINLLNLTFLAGASMESVASALKSMEADGEVEVLRPCTTHCVQDGRLTFYRLRRLEDSSYLWEQKLMVSR